LNNYSHNTLVVDGQLQRVAGNAPMTGFYTRPGASHALLDLTPVYEGQLASARRGLRLDGQDALIQDELAAPDREITVRWGMATRAEVELDESEPGLARLKQNEQTLALRVCSPSGAVLKLMDVSEPQQDYDAANPGVKMIL